MNTILLLAAVLAAPLEAEKPTEQAAKQTPAANAPETVRDSGPVFRIPENSAAGTAVGTIPAPKGSNTEGTRYSIVSGNHDDLFAIDPHSGAISVKNGGLLDFEAHPVFKLGIEVKSAVGDDDKLRNSFAEQLKKSGADSATVAKIRENVTRTAATIELTDINEPPVLPMQSWTARSDVPTGTVFGKLAARDQDKGDRLQYSTNDEVTGRFFVVDPDSGEIAVRDPAALQNALDGRTTGAFVAQFLVTDSAGHTKVTRFPVTLEGPAKPTAAELAISEVAATKPEPVKADPAEVTLEEVLDTAALPESTGDFNEEAHTIATSQPAPQPAGGSIIYRLLNLAVMFAAMGMIYWLYLQSQKPGGADAFSPARRVAELRPSVAAGPDSLEIERSRLLELKSELDRRGLQIAAESQQLQAERAELLEVSRRAQADREEAERRHLAEVEERLNLQRNDLAAKSQELDEAKAAERQSLVSEEEQVLAEARKAIEVERSQLLALKSELESRDEAIAAKSSELESQKSELLEESSRVQADRERLEIDRQLLDEVEAGLHLQRQDLAAKMQELSDAHATERHSLAATDENRLEEAQSSIKLEESRLETIKAELDSRQKQVAAKQAELESERAALLETSTQLRADREEIESIRRRLVESESELDEQRRELAERLVKLDEAQAAADQRALALAAEPEHADSTESLERGQLLELQAELEARQQQLAAQAEELEAQRAELLEESNRVQYEREDVEAHRRQLADFEADLQAQHNALSDRILQLNESQQSYDRRPMDSVDAAEKLVDIAAADFDGTPSEPESVEVLELRHRLADMFGVSDTELARHRESHPQPAYDEPSRIEESAPEPSFESFATEIAAAPEPIAVAEVASQPVEHKAPEDCIDTYMRDLLERQRVRQLYGSAAAEMETTRVVAPVVQRKAEPVAAAPAVEAAPEKPVSTSPVHPQDKEAVRNDLASLRTVANQAARSAVLRHTKKKLRNHSMIKVSCAAVSFATAGIVFSTSVAVTTMLGWAAAGIGGIVLVDLAHRAYVSRKTNPQKSED